MKKKGSSSLALLLFLGLALLAAGPASGGNINYNAAKNTWTTDYVVVGTGAGGSPLLRKLTDDYRYSAIGLEAGDNYDDDPMISVPANLNLGISPIKYDWIMEDVKQRPVGVGRMTGGSTSHNGMQYCWVSPAYASLWNQYGGDNWNSANIFGASKEMESFYDASGAPLAPSRGTSGLLKTRKPVTGPLSGPDSMAFVLANLTSFATGYAINGDYNDPSGQNLGPFTRYQLLQSSDGTQRSSAWTTFLPRTVINKDGSPVGARQLRVLLKSTVTRVLFRGNRAIGVLFVKDGVQGTVLARREVVLATSVFTPQLLQVSGVGPASLLKSLGIPAVVANDNVGLHLSNHISVALPMTFDASQYPGLPQDDPNVLFPGGAFLPKWHADGISGMVDTGFKEFQLLWEPVTYLTPNMLMAYVVMQRPRSTGYIKVQSTDPLQIPLQDENILSDPYDVEEFASFLFHGLQNTIMDYFASQNAPYQALWTRWSTINETKAYVTANAGRVFHYNGQTRIAPSAADGVVDGSLKVFGTQGLRLAGATVLPEIADSTLTQPSALSSFLLAKMLVNERTHTFPF